MKVALFGGSFNPIHNGHLNLALSVLEQFEYEKIIFVPAFISPFKVKDDSHFAISPIDRFNMVNLAIESEKKFETSSYEILKSTPSFTIETVKYFYNNFYEIEGKIGLIIGSDNLIEIEKWKDFNHLMNMVDLIVVKREGVSLPNIKGLTFNFLEDAILPISSSRVREMIKRGDAWQNEVPEKVAQYIEENALYGLSFKEIENIIECVSNYAKKELSEKRFLHSLRVAEMAEKLSLTYSNLFVNPRVAYLSGVSHDITKEKSDEWQKMMIIEHKEILDDIEKANLRLLHGRTAAIVMEEKFGIKNRSLLDAVKHHTFSHSQLDNLGKILYIADKIEIGRENAQNLRSLIGISSIDEIMCLLLKSEEKKLINKGFSLHPEGKKLLEILMKKIK